MKKIILLLIVLPFIGLSQSTENRTLILENENLKIQIDLPEHNYKNSRFDWTGKIAEVYYKGIAVTTTEKINGTDEFIYGKGLYNEFGIETALGFDETKEGEYFHKIGVGLLKKEGEKYDFYKNYEIKPAEFKVTEGDHKIIVECISEEVNGYAYQLKKEIELSKNDIIINYHLTNTGNKTIKTDEYAHNFLAIDDELMGNQYKLQFPFEIDQKLMWPPANPEEKVEIGSDYLTFNDTPEEQFFYGNITGTHSKAQWELINSNSKIGISETGNFKPSKINVWGWKHVVSPELFFEINLEKGEEVEWTRSYRFFELE